MERYVAVVVGTNEELKEEEKDCWLWKKPSPQSKKPMNVVDPIDLQVQVNLVVALIPGAEFLVEFAEFPGAP
ncbi:hypothetical protein L195_g012770 [Trifolium pratense]|uniref:Uncharacterized protein n=1 Tax=Trifolium pratense TaxID=57577 RepID=A0A2K3PL91_TRIPR|nr:hypothetical protein L195_g012770 [Trifolium pratense]